MNILAVDYGTKRIGLAKWSSDVDVILPANNVSSAEELIDVIKQGNIDKLVVGLPISLDGNEKNDNINRVKKFVSEIKSEVEIDVEFSDERFSSQQADRMGGGVTRDEKSAMVILQSYLDSKN